MPEPMTLLTLALLAASTGMTVSEMLKKKKAPQIDISAQTARLRDLFNEQRQAAKALAQEQLQELQGLTASNLAGRGIYSSPVSEFSFGRNRAMAQRTLAQLLSGIGAQEATSLQSLTEKLMGQKFTSESAEEEARTAARRSLISLLSSTGTAAGASGGSRGLRGGGGGGAGGGYSADFGGTGYGGYGSPSGGYGRLNLPGYGSGHGYGRF